MCGGGCTCWHLLLLPLTEQSSPTRVLTPCPSGLRHQAPSRELDSMLRSVVLHLGPRNRKRGQRLQGQPQQQDCMGHVELVVVAEQAAQGRCDRVRPRGSRLCPIQVSLCALRAACGRPLHVALIGHRASTAGLPASPSRPLSHELPSRWWLLYQEMLKASGLGGISYTFCTGAGLRL